MKLFLDIGTYDGMEVYFNYLKLKEFDKIIGFEPNPKFFPFLKDKYPDDKFEFTNAAVSNFNGVTDYYLFSGESANTIHAGFIFPELTSNIKVKCIDIHDIMDRFNGFDSVTVKIDAEGSEYEILPRMISHKNYSKINKIYLEVHKNVENLDFKLNTLSRWHKESTNNFPLTRILDWMF